MLEDYLDFDLTLSAQPNTTREWELTVRSPAGEARQSIKLDIQLSEQSTWLDTLWLADPAVQPSPAKTIGRQLFEACFTGEALSRLDSSLVIAKEKGQGLRLRLVLRDPFLETLPWELLYDPRSGGGFIGLSSHTPILRYVELPRPLAPLSVQPPLRILAMLSAPKDAAHLEAETERQNLEQALAQPIAQGLLELHWVPGQTAKDLQRELRQGPWHIFHFIGHGGFESDAQEASLLLCDTLGNQAPLRMRALAPLFKDVNGLRLVVLNACKGSLSSRAPFSSGAALLVGQGVPAVVAMQHAFLDRDALEFSATFYQCLGERQPLETCLTEGRKAVSLASSGAGWGIPTLHLHSTDGRLFEMPEGASLSGQFDLAAALDSTGEIVCRDKVSGVGFCVRQDGLVLTTHSAVEGSGALTLRTHQGDLPATLITTRVDENLALLRIEGGALPAIRLIPAPPPMPGSTLSILGRNPALGIESMTGKFIGASRLADYPFGPLLTAEAQVSRRIGGAPVFDKRGRLLGMVVLMWAQGDAASKLYICPAGDLSTFIEQTIGELRAQPGTQ